MTPQADRIGCVAGAFRHGLAEPIRAESMDMEDGSPLIDVTHVAAVVVCLYMVANDVRAWLRKRSARKARKGICNV